MHRLMGIDYGSKRIGIALTNEGGEFALPQSVVQNDDHTLAEIVEMCTLNNVNKIVIGDSKDFNGEDNKIMKDINSFVDTLKAELQSKSLDIEVVFHPEFLTSLQAERLQGKNDMLDASAAALILQSYVDMNNK